MELAVTSTPGSFVARVRRALIGEPVTLPAPLAAQWPELSAVRWRRGGLPLRVGGWCLGQHSVAGITLWQTVFLADHAGWDPALMLHEYRHVEQFAASVIFPLQYVWESLRCGYAGNRFEADANAWAACRCPHSLPSHFSPGA